MTIAVQTGRIASWTGVQDSTTPFGHSISFTVDAGTDRMLCVLVSVANGTHPIDFAASYGGVALTKATSPSFAQNSSHALWYMPAPPVGTAALLVNRSAWTAASYGFTAFTLEGVDQSTPFGTTASYNHSFATSPISAAAAAAAGGATLYAAAVNAASTIAGQSGQVEAGAGTPNSSAVLFTHGYKLGASSSVGITWTGGTNQATIIGVPVVAASVPDTTAPTLTSPTGSATGSTTATVGATTDEGNGTLYAVVTTSATAPTKAQVKAGQNAAGTAANWSGSVAVSSTGAKTLNATGLTASTTYYAHLMHEDAADNQANVVSSTSFTTSAGASGSKGRYYYQFGSPQC